MKRRDNKESGNVLMYILVAVALIAALSFAVTNSSQDGGGASTERSKVLATDMLEYSNIVANAVGKLRLRGCRLDLINFDHDDLTGYDNTNAPSDGTCDVFALNGGAINYTTPNLQSLDISNSADAVWGIYGENAIEQVGSTCSSASCAELILAIENVRSAVCLAINDLLGITNPSGNPPTDTHLDKTLFTGSMGYAQTIGDESGGESLISRRAGCYSKTGSPASNVFYKVLQAR